MRDQRDIICWQQFYPWPYFQFPQNISLNQVFVYKLLDNVKRRRPRKIRSRQNHTEFPLVLIR